MTERLGVRTEENSKMDSVIDKDQRLNEGQVVAEDRKLELSDDEEVVLHLPRPLLASAGAPTPVPAPVPEVPVVEKLLQRLVAETQIRHPTPVVASEPAGLETLLRLLLSGHLAPVQQPRQGSFRRYWNAVVCFSCGKAGHSATRFPTLDDTFSCHAAGMEGREDTEWLCDDFTPGGGRASSSGKRRTDPGGFATRISSKVRPKEPREGRGAARIPVPREGVDIGTRNSSVSRVVGPQLVPSRISVVLVEETEVRCAERLASIPADKGVRLLAGVACLAGL